MILNLHIKAGGDEAAGWNADILTEDGKLWAKVAIDGSELLSLQQIDDLEAKVVEVGEAADLAIEVGGLLTIRKEDSDPVDPYEASVVKGVLVT